MIFVFDFQKQQLRITLLKYRHQRKYKNLKEKVRSFEFSISHDPH